MERAPGDGALQHLLRDQTGTVLALAAAATLVLAALIGGGVDMARAYRAERRLQAACDAGVLAGRSAVGSNGFDTAAEQAANRFFNVNYSNVEQDTTLPVFTPESPDDGETIEGTATATLNTIIMGIFGFRSLDLSVDCSASMGVGNSDIMFVLDNTGSMDWAPDGTPGVPDDETRMAALQASMKSFFDTVAAANAGSNARIRYGFVPYSSAVNVGDLLMGLDSSYVADTITVQSREPVNWSGVVETWTETGTPTTPQYGSFSRLNDTRYGAVENCNSAKPADSTNFVTYDTQTNTVANFDPARGQKVTATGTQTYQYKADYECIYRDGDRSVRGYYVNRRYITRELTSHTYEARNPIVVTTYDAAFTDWLYRPVTRSVSTYKTANARALVSSSSGRTRWNTASTWGGCIQERETTPADAFTFVSLLTGITPGEALDLDIDAAPTADDDTKWKPLWGSVTFSRNSRAASLSGNSSPLTTACPDEAQLLEEMNQEDFDAYVDGLSPTGSTYHDIGLIWGARLSSPAGIFSDTVNDEPDNGGTVSRHLIFMTDGELDPSPTTNSSYGYEFLDRRVTTDGRDSTMTANHRERYLAVCEAIKARGIRLWVVAFGTTLTDDLQSSGDGDSGCSSPDSAFQADNAEELDEHFQEIANQVGELRVTQ